MIFAGLWLAAVPGWSKSPGGYRVYVGTYTGQGSDGIYLYHFDAKSGELKKTGLAAKLANPSFLTLSPDEKFLYAVSEVNRQPVVASFSVGADGMLTAINQSSTKGGGPCFVATDKTGSVVMAANYGGGSVASFHVTPDGHLSEAVTFIQHEGSSADKARQEGPHAHSINASPDNRFAISADLGTDELNVYRIDLATGVLTPNTPSAAKVPAGDGPRHLVFHPQGHTAYVINELRNTVTRLEWDAKTGVLHPKESISTLPADFKGENSTAEVQIHPSGKWLYGSNRGHDSIAVFSVNVKTGKLKAVEQVSTKGSMPRNFRLDPSGNWLIAANQKGNNLTVFRIDPKTGRLKAVGEPVTQVAPVCVKFASMR